MVTQFNSPLELSAGEPCTTSSTFLKAPYCPIVCLLPPFPSLWPCLSLLPSLLPDCRISLPSTHLFYVPSHCVHLTNTCPEHRAVCTPLLFLHTCPIYTNLTWLLTEREVVDLPSLYSNSPNNKVSMSLSRFPWLWINISQSHLCLFDQLKYSLWEIKKKKSHGTRSKKHIKDC